MKLYRTRTREEYYWLMDNLEKEHRRWSSGDLPTEFDGFIYSKNTIIRDDKDNGFGLMVGHVRDKEKYSPDTPIIEVKKLMEEE